MKISKEIPKWVLILAFIIVLIINYLEADTNKYHLPTNGEFYTLFVIFIFDFIRAIPIKIKNWCKYQWYKINLWWKKRFKFKLSYIVNIDKDNYDKLSFSKIKQRLQEVLWWKMLDFVIDSNESNLFKYNDSLKIKLFEQNQDNWEIVNQVRFLLNNNNYTIWALEKDIEIYSHIINIINWFIVWENTKISYDISIDDFYTPDYLLNKFYSDQKEFTIDIWENITFKKEWKMEQILINWTDITIVNNNLKNYLNLSL